VKVLLFCPLHPQYVIYPEAKASIDALDTTGFDVTVHFESEAHTEGIADAYDAVTVKYQEAQRIALEGDYDAMLTVEADNIVPVDALQKLSRVDADVAYGLYCARHNSRWLAFLKIWDSSGVTYSLDESTTKAAWGNVVESAGVGFGCTFIHRHVLEAIPFRRVKGHPCANDWFFALDCIAAGYRQKHDCSVLVGHIRQDRPKVTIWPIPEAPFHRIVEEAREERKNLDLNSTELVEYICNCSIVSQSQNQYYQPGESIWMTPEQAIIHLDNGQISPKPEPIVIEPQSKRQRKSDTIQEGQGE
jgi:hypothetical protein